MVQIHSHPYIHKRVEPYPAHSLALRMLDSIIYLVGVIGPLFTLPQLYEIFVLHNASGVSPLTWGGYALLDIPWILYGIVHHERPITITYTLWLIFNGAVFVGAVIYGA